MTINRVSQPRDRIIQLRVRLCRLSPAIWRRILVEESCTIADLHHILQLLMNWSDEYLHHFLIRGKRYGIWRPGTIGFYDDANLVELGAFAFRQREKFVYRYNYYDRWELELRVEAFLAREADQFYPTCIAGKRAALAENCGGPKRFLELKDHYSFFHIASRMNEIIQDENLAENRWDYEEEIRAYLYWLNVDRFARRELNQHLRQRFGQKAAGLSNLVASPGGLVP